MTNAEKISKFEALVLDTRGLKFNLRFSELRAFAFALGAHVSFDSDSFSLWNNCSPSAKLLVTVTVPVGN